MERLTLTHPKIPDWLKYQIYHECPYCNAPIVNDGANDTLTQRYCPNPACPGHMAEKIVLLAKHFDITGIGSKTALKLISLNNLNHHLEALVLFFPNEKPLVNLWEVGKLAMIHGLDNAWKDITVGFGSFADLFAANVQVSPLIFANRFYLMYCEKFFRIKPPLSRSVLHVMITGSVNGYSNRNHFVDAVNNRYGRYVQVIQVGNRLSNVDYLIIDSEFAMGHPKYETALRAGIPIVSSTEFMERMSTLVSYIIMKGDE